MKWIKHYNNVSSNKLLDELLSRPKGHEMYALYWLLLETLCEDFKKNTTVFEISSHRLKRSLRITYDSKIKNFFKVLTESSQSLDQDLFKIIQLENKLWKIETPIILELIGKDFKRTRHRGGTTTAKKKEKEIEEEKETKVEIPASPVIDFEIAYAMYPKKAGKTIGMKKAKSKIKSQKKYDQFIQAIKNYSKQCEMKDPQFILHFSTFVGRFEDFVQIQDEPASNKPSQASIFAAISSGMDSLKDLHQFTEIKLSEAECAFIQNNGGLRQLSKMKQYDVDQLFKNI